MSKRLLIDKQGVIGLQLHESKDGKMVARGEFGRADVPTENRRVYPRKVWETQIQKIAEDMRAGKVFGELDHPSDGKTSLKRVSHIMTNLWMEDDGRIMGEAVILDNDYGRQLKSIFDAGGQVGVSSRGMGSTRMGEGGMEIVDDDYSYMTHDFVADPAVKTSYPKVSVAPGVKSVEAESIEQKNPVVVESNPAKGEMVMENKAVLTEADVSKRLDEQAESLKKSFEDRLVEKLALIRESVEKEVRAELLTNPEIMRAKQSLDQILSAVKPFVVQEDVNAEMVKKDQEIADLKVQLESKTKELAAMEESAKEIVEGAKRLGMQLFFERTMAKCEDRSEIIEMVGGLQQYKTEADLMEAIKRSKVRVLHKKKVKMAEKKKMDEEAARRDAELKRLKEENEKKNRALIESLRKEKEMAAKLYVEDRTRNHPNARIIRKLTEGVTEKSKIDAIVKAHDVAPGGENLYNNIQQRLARLDEVKAKAPAAVEQQLEESKPSVKKTAVDVDEEIASVTG